MQDPTYCSYPAEVHRESGVSTRVRRPRIHIRLRPLCFPWQEGRRRWAAMGVLLVGVAAVCMGVGLALPRLSGGWGVTPVAPLVTTDPTAWDTDPEPTEKVSETVDSAEADTEKQPLDSDTEERGEEPTEGDAPSDSAVEDTTAEDASEPAEGTEKEPVEDLSPEDTVSPPPGNTVGPDVPVEGEPSETAGREPETGDPDVPGAPEAWIPILSQDVSEVDRGAGYVVAGTENLPASLPTGRLWEGTPAVLLVNTHPYEGFSDGSSLYDPASGGLAVTETPYDPDGMVAFGSALTRALRGMGVTVIHLRVPVSAGESAGVICDRTEAMIRYYCRLYPDIGLVLDLRRSAELTETGEILRTAGCLGGEDCGQIRISVNGGKDETALGWDLAAALALRQALWDTEPTISRPVRVKSGMGLIPEMAGVRVLTVEAGSAGNTYAEAARLVAPLADAIGRILEGK